VILLTGGKPLAMLIGKISQAQGTPDADHKKRQTQGQKEGRTETGDPGPATSCFGAVPRQGPVAPAQGQKRRDQPHQKDEQGQTQKSWDKNEFDRSSAHQHDEQQRGPMHADQNPKRENIKSKTAWRGHHTDFPVINKSGGFAPTAFFKKPGMGEPRTRTALMQQARLTSCRWFVSLPDRQWHAQQPRHWLPYPP